MTRALPIAFLNPIVDLNLKLIEAEGTRLQRDQRALGRPRRSLRRRGSRPAAESECLQRKSTQQDE
ncbi:hypothetical protein [Heyndrickxia acidicola]|uniref:Uncharacterized protein n=1 Tax=Heyndrickxia acidicola TaxID=209389 RepID=A0ABU6MMX7_9BACI|nr:hypothetical protein [Heyndrickxia acidicola]MED1206052.1 hypothetical protein [Heyndrickxia acidicola]